MNVLPVPALASSTVTPIGQRSADVERRLGRSQVGPRLARPAARPTGAGRSARTGSLRSRSQPAPVLVRSRRRGQQVLERHHAAEHELVLGLAVLVVPAGARRSSTPSAPCSPVVPAAPRRRPPTSCSTAAAARASRGRGGRRAHGDARSAAVARAASGSMRATPAPPSPPRPMVTARERAARVRRSQRQQAHPCREAVLRRRPASTLALRSTSPTTPGTVPTRERPSPRSTLTSTESLGDRRPPRRSPRRRSPRRPAARRRGSRRRGRRAAGRRVRSRRSRTSSRSTPARRSLEEPVADGPPLEGVELHRQPVGRLLLDVADARCRAAAGGTP